MLDLKIENCDIWTLLKHIDRKTIPDYWLNNKWRIAKDSDYLDQLTNQEDPPHMYGVNTFVGHLDNETILEDQIEAFQNSLIDNHSIGLDQYYSEKEALYITYAKLHFLSLGGSGITLDLYNHLLDIVKNDDTTFYVPKASSYSCGDVIPAAHWAQNIKQALQTKYNYPLKRKEGLALINGSFLHVGLSLAKVHPLHSVWSLYNFNSVLYSKFVNNQQFHHASNVLLNKHDTMHHPLNWLASTESNNNYDVQDPVSIRAYPQMSSAFYNSIESFLHAIEEQLNRRSDNPLVLFEEEAPISQASFLAPMISLSASQLIEAILLIMWQVERRIHFLLSGKIKNVPLNARKDHEELGFIQVPKLVSAIVEETRIKCGRRTFASGSSTSYGTEDIWTNGIIVDDLLYILFENFNTVLAIELALLLRIDQSFMEKPVFEKSFNSYYINDFREQYRTLKKANKQMQLPIEYYLPPFGPFQTKKT